MAPGSGPWFVAVIVMTMSVGAALACVTTTSKNRSSAEDAGVTELELALAPWAFGVLRDELVVGERAVRVAVEVLRVRVGRGGVQMPPVLLGVLAVVALRVGQPEEPLLEPVVLAVPHRHGEVEEAVAVAEAGDAVLTPPVCAPVRVVERERGPRVAVGRVVLTDRPPLTAGRRTAPTAATGPSRPATRPVGRARRSARAAAGRTALSVTPHTLPARSAGLRRGMPRARPAAAGAPSRGRTSRPRGARS